MEEVQIVDGRIRNPSFTDYLIPTILDMPPVTMKVFEFPHPDSPYGLNGVGEPPNLSSTPAIMNALRNATGLDLPRAPVGPPTSSPRRDHMIIDTHLHPTNKVDEAWRHTGEPFTGERLLEMMDGPFMINGKPRRIDMGFIQPPPGNTVWRDGDRSGARASGTTWRTSRTSSRSTRTVSSATSRTTRGSDPRTAPPSSSST